MNRKSSTLAIMLALMLLFSMFCANEASSLDKVKVAYVSIMNFAPLYVAIGRDFMKEQNIEVDM